MADDPTIVRRVREFLESHRPPPGPMVVAVSGGPDSVALLRALCAIRPGPLAVAHLNHGLRGQESDTDAAFVQTLANRLKDAGSPIASVHMGKRNVADKANGENLEATARRIRYAWLTDVARELGATWVATGHSANDQAETVLFQLLRGTGLDGLAGMAKRRPLAAGTDLVRPILAVKRPEVLGYLREIGQDFRVDVTNADVNRTRSRIRHDLVPHLVQHYSPRVVDLLARLAVQADDWRRDQAMLAEKLLRAAERPRAGGQLVFDLAMLAAAPRRRRRAMWRRIWVREKWPRLGMSFHQWDRLAALGCGRLLAIDLPGGLRARRRGAIIQVGPIEGE